MARHGDEGGLRGTGERSVDVANKLERGSVEGGRWRGGGGTEQSAQLEATMGGSCLSLSSI